MDHIRQFRMPDVGEGLDKAEIIRWHVAAGDTVHDGMPVCEVETAKATVELPIPFDGVVAEIRYPEGATVDIGAVIITVDTGVADRPAVLVGYGITGEAGERRPRKKQPATPHAGTRPLGRVPAKPPVRKLARDLGVDLGQVRPTGQDGQITREDVRAHVADPQPEPVQEIAGVADEQRVPIRGIRRATAQAVVASAFTAPHVTEFLTVDVTRTMKLVGKLKQDPEFAGVRVTPLLLVVKALLTAIRRHPEVNASWDEANQEIVVKNRVNVGIAAATPKGLIVPNIKDAGGKTLRQLAEHLQRLTESARAGSTAPADMTGGTVTVTNIGVFGVDSGTPILNPGESAILAVGAIREQPWAHKGKLGLRQVTTLALSFDHRLVDGALGSAVLRDTGAVLERPARLVSWA